MKSDRNIVVVGGCGHVGLPLAILLASRGYSVDILDVNAAAVDEVNRGRMHFMERGADSLLQQHAGKSLHATTDPAVIRGADVVVCVVGTPIDDHLNPQLHKLLDVVRDLKPQLHAGQLLILRSTVYPGATRHVASWLDEHVPGVDVAFCPERIAQGYAIEEMEKLPQIVSGVTPGARERAAALFAKLAPSIVHLSPEEAELGKLFCNAWRYVSFAVANQFYALCSANGLDYHRIHSAITQDYPRMRSLPTAGFAAGPCLFKDTMQLAAYYNNEFSLGQAAMLVNEGFPRVLMQQLRKLGLADKTVGLLGLAFKADSDDTRDSLAFKMKKLLDLECKRVLCTDPFAAVPSVVPLEQVLEQADVLVIGAPHSAYRGLTPRQPVLDPWNVLQRGGLLT